MIATLIRPMAKKPERKPHASQLRQGNPTPADLRRAAEDVRGLAGNLDSLADMLDEAGLASVHIDGDKKLANGTELIRGYIKAVQKGLVDAQ